MQYSLRALDSSQSRVSRITRFICFAILFQRFASVAFRPRTQQRRALATKFRSEADAHNAALAAAAKAAPPHGGAPVLAHGGSINALANAFARQPTSISAAATSASTAAALGASSPSTIAAVALPKVTGKRAAHSRRHNTYLYIMNADGSGEYNTSDRDYFDGKDFSLSVRAC
jgi:hypothetical protein